MPYKYSGKPGGHLLLAPNRYVLLDVPKFRPSGGVTLYEAYLNIENYVLNRTNPCGCPLPGRIRVKLVRGAWKGRKEDPTGYSDIDLLPGFDNRVETKIHFELAQRGRPMWWEFKLEGAASARLGTRYAKCDKTL